MTKRAFEMIWRDQCEAAEGILVERGFVAALDYLIGEKLDTYAQTAATRPEFARELPLFVAQIRKSFAGQDIADYFGILDDDAQTLNTGEDAAELEESGILLSQAAKQARMKRLASLRSMLLETQLGTS